MMQANLSISNFKKIIKVLLFLLIFVILFNIFQEILIRKDGGYYKQKNIYNLKKNSIDLIIIGSSHSNNGFVPKVFDEILEVNSFSMGKTGARIEQVEFLLKEYLKRQSPKIVVIEGFSFTPIAEEHFKVLANWSFDAFRFSFNKINAILSTTKKNKINHIFPILEYHERWKILEKNDFKFHRKYNDKNKGWGAGNKKIEKQDEWFKKDFSNEKGIREINKSEKNAIENIIKICKEKNIKLYIVTLPYKYQLKMNAYEMVKINNYLIKNYSSDIKVLDLNREYIKNNTNSFEFQDEGHLNQKGAYKYSEIVANFIKSEEKK